MKLNDIIQPEDVLIDAATHSRASLVTKLAAHAARRTGLGADLIRAALVRREELGSTGIGRGVALPHAAIAGLDGPFAMMLVLKRPVEFQAIDDEPVDLVFLLLTPVGAPGKYLSILSAVARKLHADAFVRALRSADTSAALHALMVSEASG